MYAPQNFSLTDAIIQDVAQESGLEVSSYNPDNPQEGAYNIVGFDSLDQIMDWLWGNQNVTQGGK